MSLTDTWAATGAGAFSLSENSLYTIEAWNIFLDRLNDDGIFTVSRWHSPEKIGETGRVLALAAGTLLRRGIQRPSDHIALIAAGNISTLLVSRRPFTSRDIARLQSICTKYRFNPVVLPLYPPSIPLLRDIVSARSYGELLAATRDAELRCDPPTDEDPYFFNMLRLSHLGAAFTRARWHHQRQFGCHHNALWTYLHAACSRGGNDRGALVAQGASYGRGCRFFCRGVVGSSLFFADRSGFYADRDCFDSAAHGAFE